jgi:hypothetical protein
MIIAVDMQPGFTPVLERLSGSAMLSPFISPGNGKLAITLAGDNKYKSFPSKIASIVHGFAI